MADPAESLWAALHGGSSPLVVVFYGDLGLRERALAEVESLADPAWPILRVATLGEAQVAPPGHLVLLAPDDERSTVQDLEGLRDVLRQRDVPVVLFLVRGGGGARVLAESPSVMSWVREDALDPEEVSRIDPEEERALFLREVGVTPEEWLAEHRDDSLVDTRSLGILYRARLLER